MNARPGISFLLVGSLAISMAARQKSNPSMASSDGADWSTYGRTNDEQRFSPLNQINEQNIGQLGALYHDKVFLGTLDGRLIALDAKTGKSTWDTVTVDQSKSYAITGAPRIAKGLVLIGNAGSEFGVRGCVSAYDAETGKLVWRTFTVPGDPARGFESKALQEAAKTWHGQWWVTGGGGTPWDSIVYDPDLDLIYAGTGNGTAWYRDLRSPGGGDNLYLACIIALRASDGELVWHYQVTPGDNWDYDATQPLMLADLKIDGATRKVIMQASKNGFFYVLDRQSGQFISAKPFVKGISWASGIDPKTGRPVESATAYEALKPVLVSPSPDGAHNWYPMAMHPGIGLVYVPSVEGSVSVHAPEKIWKYNPANWNRGEIPAYEGPLIEKLVAAPAATGKLVAWDPVAQREVWNVTSPVRDSGGVLATGGSLVFQGRSDGMFCAYRATDGKKLWEFDAGTGIMAPPVTYLVGGVQYLTLMVGWGGAAGIINPPGQGPTKPGFGRVLTFAIGGNAKLDVPRFGHQGPPSPAIRVNATPATVRAGGILFEKYCFYCHGVNAIAGSGIPDLRYSTEETHHQFESIVRGGTRESRGMPAFKDVLKRDQLPAIQAYILSRASAASTPPSK